MIDSNIIKCVNKFISIDILKGKLIYIVIKVVKDG